MAPDSENQTGRSETRMETRREARRKDRLRRERIGYLIVGALFLTVVVAALAFGTARRTPVQTASIPTVAPLPKPALPEPRTAEMAPGPGTVREAADSGLVGDAAALEKRVEEIAAYYGGVYGVEVLDPSTNERVSFGSGNTFFAASVGKLPTLLSLYKAASEGEVDLDDSISMLASDVQGYGTGVLHTYPVGYTITLRECAYYLIHDSDNTAWEMLTRYLGVSGIQADLSDIGAYNTGYWTPNTTTPDDTQLILEKIADPSYTSPELSEEMLSTMTDTVYEDRIPAGLPPDVRVAHKIGTYDNSFSDAGVVFYKGRDGEEKHYFIVVFTEGAGETNARAAIQEISAAAHETFATPGR